MFTRIQLFAAGWMLAVSAASAQVGVDFRGAVERSGFATVAVRLDPGIVDRPLARQFRPRVSDLTGLFIDSPMLPYQQVNVRSGFAVAPDLVMSCDVPKEQVELVTHDGSQVSGKVVARDHVTGLVAIRIPEGHLQGLSLAADAPAAGLPVLINWLQGKTVRSEASMIASMPNADHSEIGFAQALDADFSPQKLGAPVVNGDGSLVGIVVNIRGDTLCLPAAHVSRLLESASRDEPADLQRGRLGIVLAEKEQSLITEVSQGTPAQQAGLKSGDRILNVNDRVCQTHSDVMAAVAMLRAGDEVELEIKRGDENLEIAVKLAAVDSKPGQPRYLGGWMPSTAEPIYQFKDGRIRPLNNEGDVDDAFQGQFTNPPKKLMFGNLQVERSRLEESIKKLEAEKKQQDDMIERLREEIAKKEPSDTGVTQKSVDEDIARLEKIVEELKERLLKDQPDN